MICPCQEKWPGSTPGVPGASITSTADLENSMRPTVKSLLVAMNPALLLLMTMGCGSVDETGYTGDTASETSVDTQETGDTELQPVWENERVETSSTLNDLYAAVDGLYTVGTNGAMWLYRYDSEWSSIAVDVGGADLNGIWGMSGSKDTQFVAVGKEGMVVSYSSGLLDIQDLGTANFESVDGPTPDNLVAVGWGGAYHWDGSEWDYERLPNDEQLNDVWATANLTFAVGEDGAIVSRSAGIWTPMGSPTYEDLYGISGTTETDIWAVGKDGLIIHYDGAQWTEAAKPTAQTLWAVWAADNDRVFAVGSNGTALLYDGTDWLNLYTGVDNNLYAVGGLSETDCWAVGNRGIVLHYVE